MWDEIKDRFSEAIAGALPTHRLLIIVIGFSCSLAVSQQNYKSISETLARVELRRINFGDDGFLRQAALLNIGWGLSLALAAAGLAWLLSQGLFTLISRTVKYEEKITARVSNYGWLTKLPSDLKYEALKQAQDSKAESLKRLRSSQGVGEALLAGGLSFAAASFWGNVLDIAVAVVLVCAAVMVHLWVIYFFFSNYLGPALQESILTGSQTPPALNS